MNNKRSGTSQELRRFREMFAQSPSFSCLLQGPEHRFVLVNPAYLQLIGHRDVVGQTVFEALPEVRGQGFIELLDRVFATGEPFIGKDMKLVLQRTRSAEPESRFVDFVYQPIRDESGQVTSVFVEGSDTTERHATEEALRRSESELRELNADLERRVIERAQARGLTWQLSPDLLGALNSEGYFETSNPAWQSVLGWSEAEVASMSIFEMLHPEDREHTRAGFELTQVGQPAIEFVNRYRCKNGAYRHISWVGIPEEGYVYCTGRDVTAERAAREELAVAQEALRQAQKIEAIGQLTGGIAHDFNNLLTGILGAHALIERRLLKNETHEIPRLLSAANQSAQKAAALTHRLLTFARRQSLDIRPGDVNRLVLSMEDLLDRTLGEQIELRCRLGSDLWPALTDANQLENALLNIAINARDAMPNGGVLTIETGNVVVEESATAAGEAIQAGDYVVVRVSDTGLGMTAEVLAKAIDPFFTTKPVGEGTGLGLSVIYGFLRQCGGHLRLESEPGRGTTVELYLPRARHDAIDVDLPRASTPSGKGETILVVEDDEAVRLILTDALKDLNYNVLPASDARPAIALLESELRIDLLITDVILPHINGQKLSALARSLRPTIKVLFVTGYSERTQVCNEFLGDGMDLLLKPFALDVLAERVHTLIEAAAVRAV